jgi:hypothetical protein
MNKKEINEILECLPRGRTPFYYFKDRYALMLMGLTFDEPASKARVREAGFGCLLEKPVVKKAMGERGSSTVSKDVCDRYWPAEYCQYTLQLGTWGSRDRHWDQISRGGYNLVLRLNFSLAHTGKYHHLVDPDSRYPFENWSHPVSQGKDRTLAWSRIDIDLARDEALIEEIQNDWIREALYARKLAEKYQRSILLSDQRVLSAKIREYVDVVLSPHIKMWDEAMLAATIWFLRKEIGISRIYYHTQESGAALKRINYNKPPRSIYTKLPKRFCFRETTECPAMFAGYRKAGKPKEVLRQARFQSIAWK